MMESEQNSKINLEVTELVEIYNHAPNCLVIIDILFSLLPSTLLPYYLGKNIYVNRI